MDGTTLINLMLLIVTAAAAAIAAWQAVEARRARSEARAASDDAGEHERAALTAAEAAAASSARSADAAERQAAAAERALLDRDPWIFVPVGSTQWKVTNRTGHHAKIISVLGEGIHLEELERGAVANGSSLNISFGEATTEPSPTEVVITWYGDSSIHQFAHSIP